MSFNFPDELLDQLCALLCCFPGLNALICGRVGAGERAALSASVFLGSCMFMSCLFFFSPQSLRDLFLVPVVSKHLGATECVHV